MAKEIVTWCDKHMAREEHVAATTFPLTFGRDSYTIDLCEGCAKELITPLEELVRELGVTEKSAAPAKPAKASAASEPPARQGRPSTHPEKLLAGPHPCPVCSADYTDRTQGALGQHLVTQHGLTPAMTVGTTCPVCNMGHELSKGLATHSVLHRDQMLGGESGLLGLWFLAQRDGDPHGVVAGRVAAVRS